LNSSSFRPAGNRSAITIEQVAAGQHYFCARSSAALAHFSQNDRKQIHGKDAPALSVREKEVLVLVARGDSSKEIAPRSASRSAQSTCIGRT
jgi:DNA-binding NarL/FixJ family response regulator